MQRTNCSLFDHLAGVQWKCRRDVLPGRLGGLEVHHQLELGRRLHRQVTRLLAPQDAIDIGRGAPPLIDPTIP